jgi:para-nitrobenzyl esterase
MSRLDRPDLAPDSQRLAGEIVGYWAQLARTGRPSRCWDRFWSSHQVLRFGPGAVRDFDAGAAHDCNLWRRLYPYDLAQNVED